MELSDKTVIVTGAASGIGKATAFALGRAGARVVIGDIDEVKGAATAAEGTAAGLRFDYVKLDLTKPESIESFAASALRLAQRIDVLVNAAGWDRIQPFLENPPEMWETVMAVNLMGPIRLTRAVLPSMIEHGTGKIVSVSSDAGRVGSMGETVYAAAKGGVIAFTKSLAREMARHRINVNCVCPGPTDTPLFQQQPDRMKEALTRAIPFKRIGKPEEVAEAILFFASARSDYVTGQVLSVSGGLTMVD
jgi:2-hydroxycyclohexanecarboxyl-CoA dehydrogenase